MTSPGYTAAVPPAKAANTGAGSSMDHKHLAVHARDHVVDVLEEDYEHLRYHDSYEDCDDYDDDPLGLGFDIT